MDIIAALKTHTGPKAEELRENVRSLLAQRAQIKRVITLTINTIKRGGYTEDVVEQQVDKIKDKIREVEEFDLKIITTIVENGVEESDSDLYNKQTEEQVNYSLTVQADVSKIHAQFKLKIKSEQNEQKTNMNIRVAQETKSRKFSPVQLTCLGSLAHN